MITAQSIIRDAHVALQDPDGIRWPAGELVAHLNRAQRDIQTARPDSTSILVAVPLVAGFKQSLPALAASLIDIPSNTSGERVTKVDMVQLDAVEPAWRKRTPERTAKHFMHDLRNPRLILVYPPAAVGASVDMEYSAWPVDLPPPAGVTAASVTGNLSLGDQYESAVLCMVLHYAYTKDAEFGGNAAMSSAYLQRAQALLGTDLQSSATVAPKT